MKALNHKQKIQLHDSLPDIMYKMSEGNPGALNVLLRTFKESPSIDPEGMPGFGPILNMDSYGIYASDIWKLYKDCCGEDLTGFLAAFRSVQMGLISESELWKHINGSIPFDVEQMVKSLKMELPSFAN